jgi:glycosyltransferase involved in cell wall biosynthesis
MRILYSHRVHSRDGQSVHIEELVSAFRDAGHEVLVIGPRLYERTDFGGGSGLTARLRQLLPGAVSEAMELLYNVAAFWPLCRAYRQFLPAFVYERYNLYYLGGMLLKRWFRVPFYLEINSPLADERARFGGLRLRRLAARIERSIWRSADGVFVVTAVLAEIVAAAGVPRERITVTPNGVDLRAFPAGSHSAHRDGTVTIGFIGFVRDWHGLDAVIGGLAEVTEPPIRLIVVGEGPARPALERQAETLGVARRVEFIGLQQRTRVGDLISRFDVALQPRAVAYASPLKLFEYMACSRAIIAPDQPNIREILDDGETAVLFDPADPGALWRAIRQLAGDPQRRERLGRAARRALERRDYTWNGNVARIIAAAVGGAAAPRAGAATVAPPRRSAPRGSG